MRPLSISQTLAVGRTVGNIGETLKGGGGMYGLTFLSLRASIMLPWTEELDWTETSEGKVSVISILAVYQELDSHFEKSEVRWQIKIQKILCLEN